MKNHYNFSKLSLLLKIFITSFLIISFNSAKSANYYWVGGTGNWSEFATHWATTSGGAVFHATVPVPADDVYFDSNSFSMPLQTVTIDIFSANCQDMDWTGATNNPTLVFMNSITIYGSLTFIPAMTCTQMGGLNFSTSSPATTIDFGDINLPIMQINFQMGSTGTWTMLSDMNMTDMNAMIMFNDGNLNTNGYTINTGNINIMGSAHGSWTLGNSSINCTSFSLMGMPSILAINPGTSTINIINGNSSFMGAGYTFYNVNFDGLSMGTSLNLNGECSFELLSFNNISTVLFPQNMTTTVADLQFNGSCANVVTVASATSGYTANIFKTNGSVTEDYLAIKDITILGGASFISDNSSDLGNVNNWTINAAASTTLYWVGGTGSWNDPTHWSFSSGGPQASACAPTVNDDVIFDVNSFSAAGQIVSIDGNAFCHDITWTGVINNPDLAAFNFWGDNLYMDGTMLLDPNMTLSFNGAYNFVSDNAGEQINTQNIPLAGNVFFSGSGEWTLVNSFQCSYLYVNQGSFITNNNNLTAISLVSNSGLVRSINLGSSLVTLSSSWQLGTDANLTFTAGTSTITFSSNATFQGGDQTYCNVAFGGNAGIYHSNTFINIGFQSGTTASFEAGSIQNIINMVVATGSCGSYIILQSQTDGSQATINKAIGNVTVDYCRLKDMNATGGAIFNATNSIDMGNNSGWVITTPATTTYYWVGGTGNWNDPAHWATSSGGVADACIPSWSDNVMFDGGSGLPGQTVTVNVTSGCNNFTWSVPNATLAGTSYDLYVSGSFTLNAAMVINFGSGMGNNSLIFNSDNPGNIITLAGKNILANIEFNGIGDWSLAGNMSCSRSIHLHKGNLNTNNNIINCSSFYSQTSEIRQLSLGNQTHTLSGNWYLQDGTNFTMNAGTSTLNIAGNYYHGGDKTYNIVNLTTNGYIHILGGNNFATLNIPNSKNVTLEGGKTQTITNLTLLSGIDCNNYNNLYSNVPGTPATIIKNGAAVNLDFMNISDVMAAGTAVCTANNSIGIGDVTGWIINPPVGVTHYWVGGTGNWNDNLHWSAASGGLGGLCQPTTLDDVVFDANSFLDQDTVNMNTTGYCKSMDWTGAGFNPMFQMNGNLNINGSLTYIAAMEINTWSGIKFISGTAVNTITTAGQELYYIYFDGSGTYTLQDNIAFSYIYFNNGILNTNNVALIGENNGSFNSNSISTRTLNLGSSNIEVYSWDISDPTNMTLNAGTSDILLTNNPWLFRGGDLSYFNLEISTSDMGGYTTIYGSNSFNILKLNQGSDIRFESGETQTTTDFLATGNSGDPTFIHSFTPGVQAFISQASQEFCGDWLDIQDLSVGTQTFYAGENSNDLGNNAGWTWSGVTAIDQYPAGMCEDVPGGGTVAGINLTLLEATIDGGNGYNHTWYLDAALTTLVPVPTNVTVSNGQIFYDEVDNGICTNVAEVIYTVYPLPVASFVITDVTCNGGNDGAVDLTVNSGTSPFTCSWSTGAGTEDISALIAGTYTVTITDIEGCQTIDNAVVSQPTAISIDSEAYTDITCNGDNDGTITITASGGTGALTYDLGTGAQATGNFIGLPGGVYTVTVTDISLCTVTSSIFTITDPAAISIDSEAFTDITCNGDNDGTITVTASGGTGALTYDLGSGGQATGTFSGLSGGTYTVTVTDINSCTATSSAITITDPPALVLSETHIDVTCNGDCDGSIDLTVVGGIPPITHVWGPIPAFTEDLSGLCAGSYNVTVTDAHACIATLVGITITEPSAISIDSEAFTDITCNGNNDGTITVTASGGTGALTYDLGAGGQATGIFPGLMPGTYTVTVTDANLCTATSSAIIISEPPPITIAETHTNVTCNGDCDGSIDITVGGGIPGYSITWSNAATTEDLIGLCPGTYDVTVTDSNGCTEVLAGIVITEPSALTIDSEAYTDITCNGDNDGTITITASGGTGVLSYDLGAGGQATGNFTALSGGTYTVTVTDANLCTATSSAFTIIDPVALSIVTETFTEVSCNGGTDGTVVVVTAGGTGALSYDIGSGAQIDGNFTGLLAGTYTVTITDVNSCTITSSTFILNDPAAISIDTEAFTDILCNGNNDGTVTITASGGTGVLTYDIGSGAQATGDFTGLMAGSYTVTVEDANACTETSSMFTLTDPAAITLSETHTDVTTCGGSDGSIDLTASGGTGGLNFDWTGPASYTASTEDINALISGAYTVVVTDANACEDSLLVGISEVGAPTITLDSQTDLLCFGECTGDATVSAAGGTAPYTFTWSNSDSGTFADSLCLGPYSVTVVDAATCMAVTSLTIIEPAELTATHTSTDETCFGACDGTATITAIGGTPALSYDIGFGPQATGNFVGLCGGIYTCTITDANGCTYVDLFQITPYNMTDTITATNILCFGDCDAIATVTAYEGSGSYSYLWDNAQTTPTIAGLCAGAYYVTITDDVTGCFLLDTIVITEPSQLSLALSSTDDNGGAGDGTATVIVSGGTPGYTYLWDDPATQITSVATGLFSGLYTVIVTDTNGCSISDTVTVHLFVSINDISNNTFIKIYPNPNHGDFTIEIDGIITNYIMVDIFNVNGQKIYTNKINTSITSINLENEAEGVYFIKMSNNEINKVEKIIVR